MTPFIFISGSKVIEIFNLKNLVITPSLFTVILWYGVHVFQNVKYDPVKNLYI